MNNRLYIGNRIIETTDELKELFGLEDMANPSSSLFSKLLDNVYDGVLQDFLRSNGEIDLAEKVECGIATKEEEEERLKDEENGKSNSGEMDDIDKLMRDIKDPNEDD